MNLDRPVEIANGVYWVGVNDLKTIRFENMWPIPKGISYNAYVMRAEGHFIAVDGVKDIYTDEYLEKLTSVVGDLSRVKYVVVNHLEGDHQGSLEELLRRAPEAKVVTNNIAARMIGDFYDVPKERVIPVADGEEVNLGRRLKFMLTPWLHWPETMVTFDLESRILFTCDIFGSYNALPGSLFDDELRIDEFIPEAKRYYVNIIGKYSKNTIDAIEKLKPLLVDAKVIAPGHGPIYRRYLNLMPSLYRDWALPKLDPEVSILYISMYGHTERLARQIADMIRDKRLDVKMIDAAEEHTSYVLSEANNSAAVIIMFPTYDASIPMPLQDVLYTFEVKKFGRERPAGVVTSYGWGPIAKAAAEQLAKAGFTVVEPLVTLRTRPRPEEMAKLNEMVDNVSAAALAALAAQK